MSKRKLFYAVVEFSAPAGNILNILANDEEHARATLAEMHKEVKDFRIVDLHDMDENPEFKQMLEMQMAKQDTDGGTTPPTSAAIN